MDSSTTVPVSSVDHEKGYMGKRTPQGSNARYHIPILLSRYLAFAATLSAFCIMITNKQSKVIPFLGVQWAKYHYSDAFLYFVIANCIAFIYTLLTALLTTFSRSYKLQKYLLILDLIVTYIILSGAAAATAVAYIGDRGLKETRWSAICGVFHRYCAHVLGALVASFLGWVFLTLAVIFSGLERHSDH